MLNCRPIVVLTLITALHLFEVARSFGEYPMRTWRSSDGRHRTSARYVSMDDEGVTLLKDNGRTVSVVYGKLSGPDRSYLAQIVLNEAAQEMSEIGRLPANAKADSGEPFDVDAYLASINVQATERRESPGVENVPAIPAKSRIRAESTNPATRLPSESSDLSLLWWFLGIVFVIAVVIKFAEMVLRAIAGCFSKGTSRYSKDAPQPARKSVRWGLRLVLLTIVSLVYFVGAMALSLNNRGGVPTAIHAVILSGLWGCIIVGTRRREAGSMRKLLQYLWMAIAILMSIVGFLLGVLSLLGGIDVATHVGPLD